MENYAYAKRGDNGEYIIFKYDEENRTPKMCISQIKCNKKKMGDAAIETIMKAENILRERSNALNESYDDLNSTYVNKKFMKSFGKIMALVFSISAIIGLGISTIIEKASLITALLTVGESLLLVGLPVYIGYIALTHYKGMPNSIINRLKKKTISLIRKSRHQEESIDLLESKLHKLKQTFNYQVIEKSSNINYELLKGLDIKYISTKDYLPKINIPVEERHEVNSKTPAEEALVLPNGERIPISTLVEFAQMKNKNSVASCEVPVTEAVPIKVKPIRKIRKKEN